MLKRQGFITNSSSTSYIAYGFCLPTTRPVDPESDEWLTNEDGDELEWEDFYEEKTGLGWNERPVEFDRACHSDDAVVYIDKSQSSIDYGYTAIPSPEVQPEWDKILKDTCEILGIEPQKPGWFGWYTGMDG